MKLISTTVWKSVVKKKKSFRCDAALLSSSAQNAQKLEKSAILEKVALIFSRAKIKIFEKKFKRIILPGLELTPCLSGSSGVKGETNIRRSYQTNFLPNLAESIYICGDKDLLFVWKFHDSITRVRVIWSWSPIISDQITIMSDRRSYFSSFCRSWSWVIVDHIFCEWSGNDRRSQNFAKTTNF